MSKVFEKLIREAIDKNCSIIQLDNESEGFEIYLISEGTGFPADLTNNEIIEIKSFLRKVKKIKGNFNYMIDNKQNSFNVKFKSDFGEEVFTLKIKGKFNNTVQHIRI